MKPKVIVAIVLGALFFIILLQNIQVASLKLLFWEISMSRIILFPLLMLAGFIIGFFVGRK
ncbi:MAG: DUF1049 domain-containing protein [Candidatus Omnitrophota bacterium]|nr:MAG: DUF1049 domain-containing protein [Candidatus Omnitrophota bacterium]